jgi:hypothetical protein
VRDQLLGCQDLGPRTELVLPRNDRSQPGDRLGPDHPDEARRLVAGGAADRVTPMTEDREAGDREPRLGIVARVRPDDSGAAARRAVRDPRRLEDDDAGDAQPRQMVGDGGAVDPAAYDDRIGGPRHSHQSLCASVRRLRNAFVFGFSGLLKN